MELGILGSTDDAYFSASVSSPTVDSILSSLGSGLGLDISKNHTGVCIYSGGTVKRYGFKLDEYDDSNPHAEYLMRKNLKDKLSDLLKGMKFEHCIVEDVYGGINFDTVRKLLALNTVIDELIYDGVIEVTNFYRWLEPTWISHLRTAYVQERKCLNVKYETQLILEELKDDFVLANRGLSEAEKAKLFYEDICDATGMLCAVALYNQNKSESKSNHKKITMKDIKLFYIENEDFYLSIPDDRARLEQWVYVDTDSRPLERKILEEAEENKDYVLAMNLPVKKLGRFGIENKLPFYPSGEGVLVWYLKKG